MRPQAPAESKISTLARDLAPGQVPREGRNFGLGVRGCGGPHLVCNQVVRRFVPLPCQPIGVSS